MKRLVVFCDGTWNRIGAQYPTNVVLAARSVLPRDAEGIQQVVYYDEGVGATPVLGKFEAWLAGALGLGLVAKVASAYRFLMFNYEPGDEIYIFGFSRGAFTARSLAGMIRKCGILKRDNTATIAEAFKFYKDRLITPGDRPALEFRREKTDGQITRQSDRNWFIAQGSTVEQADALTFVAPRYIGVWDTVGALGIPRHIPIVSLAFTDGQQFHDHDLSSSVAAARHAVAIDENRRSFEPTLWQNLSALNRGKSGEEALFRQMYFPGPHGGVGGGGANVGLSHEALVWIIEGAQGQGLAFDEDSLATARDMIDPLADLDNRAVGKGIMDALYVRKPRAEPSAACEISPSAITRLTHAAPDWTPYRPEPLRQFWPD